jgi:hypothetical protein
LESSPSSWTLDSRPSSWTLQGDKTTGGCHYGQLTGSESTLQQRGAMWGLRNVGRHRQCAMHRRALDAVAELCRHGAFRLWNAETAAGWTRGRGRGGGSCVRTHLARTARPLPEVCRAECGVYEGAGAGVAGFEGRWMGTPREAARQPQDW